MDSDEIAQLAGDLLRQMEEHNARVKYNFSHILFNINIKQLLSATISFFRSDIRIVAPDFLCQRRYARQSSLKWYCRPMGPSQALAWFELTDLAFLVGLADSLNAESHWLTLVESGNCGGYLQFPIRSDSLRLLEPPTFWAAGEIDVEALGAKAIGRYESADAFLESVRQTYTPVDTAWSYQMWDDDAARDKELARGSGPIQGALRCIVTANDAGITPVGCDLSLAEYHQP